MHGGARFREPVVIDDDVRRELEGLTELAPLHNAPALAAIDEARRALPDVPHVAVFDTAFHATIPEEASTYALPRRWREEWGIRRYGFHGLSVAWAAERVPVSRLVVCHLGGGCSVTAVLDGRSVDTTMGFSPLEGVPMATRPGSIDPEILLYLQRHAAADADGARAGARARVRPARPRRLRARRGARGLRGAGERGSRSSVFCYRVAAAVAAMAAALGGLDALVFTAGVGEGSALVRARVCARLGVPRRRARLARERVRRARRGHLGASSAVARLGRARARGRRGGPRGARPCLVPVARAAREPLRELADAPGCATAASEIARPMRGSSTSVGWPFSRSAGAADVHGREPS